jgi:hypothetical protein
MSVEDAMAPCIAFTVFLGIAVAASGALAACPPHPANPHPDKPHSHADHCVDLNAVPQISAQIVASEPAPAKAAAAQPQPTEKYEGPTIGVTKPDPGVRPTPTVGYHWNLE